MRPVPASTNERRIWVLACRAYKNAFGSSEDPRFDVDISGTGHLWVMIPLPLEYAPTLWEVIGASKDGESFWPKIMQQKSFLLHVRSQKYQKSIFRNTWLSSFSFEFNESVEIITVANLLVVERPTVVDVFSCVDQLLRGQRPAKTL